MSTWSCHCRQAARDRDALCQRTSQQPPHQGKAEKSRPAAALLWPGGRFPAGSFPAQSWGCECCRCHSIARPPPASPSVQRGGPLLQFRRAPCDWVYVTFTPDIYLQLPLSNEEAAPAKEVPLLQLRQQLAGHHCALAGGGPVAPQGAHHTPIPQLHLRSRMAVESSSLLDRH